MKQDFNIHKLTGVMLVLSFFCCSSVSARIIYVDDNASGQNDGSSWENAFIYLQDALFEAAAAEKPIEIKVAQGIYTPDKGTHVEIEDIFASFEMLIGVTLSGGHAGHIPSETEVNPNTRDIELYQSILSGDLLNNDSNNYDPNNLVNDPNFFDNSYHVVKYSSEFSAQSSESQNMELSVQNKAVLDGFTITAGNARGYNYYFLDFDSTSRGGGIYIDSAVGGSALNQSGSGPVITNCTFTINAAYQGGAIYNTNGDPNISNCKFIKNSSNYLYKFTESPVGGTGGAIYNSQSNIILSNCEFIENLASSGAALYNVSDSNGVITNCKFIRNTANLSNGGAIVTGYYSSPVLNACIFQENSAISSGGAIYNLYKSEPNITNCSFIKNSTTNNGGAIANQEANPNLTNCTFSGNHSYNSGGFDNYYGNPVFSSCVFSNNTAERFGGAMQNYFGNIKFRNCIFSGNISKYSGGALFNIGGIFIFINCTATGNSAGYFGLFAYNKPFKFPPNLFLPSRMDFLNCIIWNDENAILNEDGSTIHINYSSVQNGLLAIHDLQQGLSWGNGNNDSDPLFITSGFWVDANEPNIIVEPFDPNAFWLEGDYHLQSTAGHYDPNSQTWILDDLNSPCIDAGDPNSPIENEPLPNGGRINMGAFGGTTQASLSPELPAANKEPDETEVF